jgi:hypothetical protein
MLVTSKGQAQASQPCPLLSDAAAAADKLPKAHALAWHASLKLLLAVCIGRVRKVPTSPPLQHHQQRTCLGWECACLAARPLVGPSLLFHHDRSIKLGDEAAADWIGPPISIRLGATERPHPDMTIEPSNNTTRSQAGGQRGRGGRLSQFIDRLNRMMAAPGVLVTGGNGACRVSWGGGGETLG